MRVSSGTDSIIIQPNKNKKTNKNKTKVWTWEAGRAGGELEASWSPVRCGVKSHCGASGHAHRRWGGGGGLYFFRLGSASAGEGLSTENVKTKQFFVRWEHEHRSHVMIKMKTEPVNSERARLPPALKNKLNTTFPLICVTHADCCLQLWM